MAVSLAPPTSFRAPKQQTTQVTVFPAPLQGMDARIPLAAGNMESCIWAINMVPTEYSMRVRAGTREWTASGLNGAEVRTVMPFIGDRMEGTADKLFVATKDGIYDCTGESVDGVLMLAFTTTTGDAGFGVYTQYIDESGETMIFYADRENGLFTYTPETGTWQQAENISEAPGSVGTLDVTNICFVTVHKLRIWLIEKNAQKAWYLGIRATQGTAEEFFFAAKFKHGGDLVGLYNWTVDGGLGRDDHLVAISRGGDVIPWTGEDPADGVTWSSTGTFYVGPVPQGHRVASEYGGELYILSKYGVTSLTHLLQGQSVSDPYSNQIGHKVARLLRQDLEDLGSDWGWAIKFVPNIGSLLVSVPIRSDGRYRQYVYSLATQGWGLWRDVPMLSSDTWKGALMVGTADGRVLRMDQNRDNISSAGSIGDPIEWFLLTSFSHLGSPGNYKRAKFIRPNFVAETEPLYEVEAYWDYSRRQGKAPQGTVGDPTGNRWDFGIWGEALWSFTQEQPFNSLLGASGIGRAMAVSLVGASNTACDLVSIDVMWDTGGMI